MKLVLLGLMVASNTVGCTIFVKSLNVCESSLPATVASAATNYVCSVGSRIRKFETRSPTTIHQPPAVARYLTLFLLSPIALSPADRVISPYRAADITAFYASVYFTIRYRNMYPPAQFAEPEIRAPLHLPLSISRARALFLIISIVYDTRRQ